MAYVFSVSNFGGGTESNEVVAIFHWNHIYIIELCAVRSFESCQHIEESNENFLGFQVFYFRF